jgi:hypothetical protein
MGLGVVKTPRILGEEGGIKEIFMHGGRQKSIDALQKISYA